MQNYNNRYPYNTPMYNPTPRVSFSYIMGVEGAKAFFVEPNQTVFLMDSQDKVLYEKSADLQGHVFMKAYRLSEISDQPKEEYVTKKEFEEFVAKLNAGGTHE